MRWEMAGSGEPTLVPKPWVSGAESPVTLDWQAARWDGHAPEGARPAAKPRHLLFPVSAAKPRHFLFPVSAAKPRCFREAEPSAVSCF